MKQMMDQRLKIYFLVYLFSFVCCQVASFAENKSQCINWGFKPDSLECGICDKMEEFFIKNNVDQSQVVDECRSCCISKSSLTGEKYASAILEVCQCQFGKYPQVANFIRDEAKGVKNLVIKYKDAQAPHLLFLNKEGEVVDDISITSWKGDSILEYLEQMLVKE